MLIGEDSRCLLEFPDFEEDHLVELTTFGHQDDFPGKVDHDPFEMCLKLENIHQVNFLHRNRFRTQKNFISIVAPYGVLSLSSDKRKREGVENPAVEMTSTLGVVSKAWTDIKGARENYAKSRAGSLSVSVEFPPKASRILRSHSSAMQPKPRRRGMLSSATTSGFFVSLKYSVA